MIMGNVKAYQLYGCTVWMDSWKWVPRLYVLTQLVLVRINGLIRIEIVSYQLYGYTVWMDWCEWVPRLYGLARRGIVRMNESDQKRKRINCMDVLNGCTDVNEWLDFLDSPKSYWLEWTNHKQKRIYCMESWRIVIISSDCMDSLEVMYRNNVLIINWQK